MRPLALLALLLIVGCAPAAPAAPTSAAVGPATTAPAPAKPATPPSPAASVAPSPSAAASVVPSPSAAARPSPAAAGSTGAVLPTGQKLPPLNPPVKVVVADNQTLGTADVWIALDRGYYQEEGLDIELQQMLVPVVIQSLATSSVDFAITNPDPALFNAMDRGLDIKLLAALTRNKPGDKVAAMLVRKDLIDSGTYHSPKDLKGLRVGIPANQSQFYVDLFMQKDGLAATDTDLQTLAPTDLLAAFASKSIDAAWTAEPIATLSVQQGLAQEVAVTGDLFTGAVGASLTVSPKFAQGQPEAAQRFVYATLRGHEEYYHAFIAKDIDKTATVQSMVTHSLIKDPKLYDTLGLASVDPVPTMDGASWGTLQDYFVKISLQGRKIDLEPAIDNSYIQNAAKRLGIQ